jgi:hypothetical protein
MSDCFRLKTLLKWLDERGESEDIFGASFNRDLAEDLGLYIIADYEIQTLQEQNKAKLEEIQKLKADRAAMLEALKYSESQFRYVYNISSTPDIGECAKYCSEKVQQALKSIGEAE